VRIFGGGVEPCHLLALFSPPARRNAREKTRALNATPSPSSSTQPKTNKTNRRVADLFQSVQLNVNNPHFLIMQGRVTKVREKR